MSSPSDDAEEVWRGVATPAYGSIRTAANGVEIATCDECDEEIWRVAPDTIWDHMDTDEEECANG